MEMIWAEWSKSFVSSIRTTVLVDIPGIVDGPNSYIFLYRTGYRRCPWMKNVVSSTRRSFSNYLEGPGPPYSCTCSLQRRIPPHPVIDSVIGVTDDCSLFDVTWPVNVEGLSPHPVDHIETTLGFRTTANHPRRFRSVPLSHRSLLFIKPKKIDPPFKKPWISPSWIIVPDDDLYWPSKGKPLLRVPLKIIISHNKYY